MTGLMSGCSRLTAPVLGSHHRWMSGLVATEAKKSAVDGYESEFDNEFVEDVMAALPKDWTPASLAKNNWVRGTNTNTDWSKAEVFFPVKKTATHTRSSYTARKTYLRTQYDEVISNSQFMLVFTHYLTVKDFEVWKSKVAAKGGSLRVMCHFKNALIRVCLKEDEGLAPLQSLFKDKVAFVVGSDPETVIQDIAKVMSVKPLKGQGELLWLGAAVQKTVVDHEQLDALTKAGSEASIRAQIIGILMGAPRNLVRTLKYPTDNLVKVLDFKAGPKEEEAPEEGEAAAPVEAASEEEPAGAASS